MYNLAEQTLIIIASTFERLLLLHIIIHPLHELTF